MAESASKQMTKQLKVTQVRSGIGGTHRQRESLKTLGLRKIRQSVVREAVSYTHSEPTRPCTRSRMPSSA